MGPRVPKMPEDVGVRPAGLFEGVGKDSEASRIELA
jgi:hypothetical protein